jgi:two-component system, sensor histidine kinase
VDTTLSLIDRQGTLVARCPDPDSWVGQSRPNAPIFRTVLAEGEGTAELPDLDGVARLFAFKPLVGSGPQAVLLMAVGIAKDVVFSDADGDFFRNLLVLGVVALLGMAVNKVSAEWLILRLINALVRAAGQLATGDLRARSGLPHGQGELGRLSRTFDAMAHELETRQAQSAQAEEALRESERRYRSMFADNPLPMWVYDVDTLAFLEVRGYAGAVR